LDEASRREIEAVLGRTTGKQVVGQYAVDESVIGGLVARVGSVVYDGSVRGQLQAMRDRLVRS
jgi:F-type H+-transporting ATPase subunit delta